MLSKNSRERKKQTSDTTIILVKQVSTETRGDKVFTVSKSGPCLPPQLKVYIIKLRNEVYYEYGQGWVRNADRIHVTDRAMG